MAMSLGVSSVVGYVPDGQDTADSVKIHYQEMTSKD
jgi:hypothetical protein